MLAQGDTDDAIFVVTRRGVAFRGFFASRRMLWASPRLYPLLAIFCNPGTSLLGPRIYAWVPRRRRSLGCASGACEVPAPTRAPGG